MASKAKALKIADTPDFDAVKKALRKGTLTIDEIAEMAGVGKRVAKAWVKEQVLAGLNLYLYNGAYSLEKTPVHVGGPIMEIVSEKDDTFHIGALGDSHLGSKYERLDVLHDLYDDYLAEGITQVFHSGNWIDGEARFNRPDVKVHGMGAQLRYLAEVYPQRDGISTYSVAGDDHEGWYGQRESIDIGKLAENEMREQGRADWHHLGFMEAFIKLVNRNSGASSMMLLMHPGGGSSYATSYTVQKIVESLSGGEKPAVLLAGHYHKMEVINYRNVWCVQTGCTQDQTPFMRKKRIEPHVGGHRLRMKQDPRTGAIVEMNGARRYFNVGYYNNRWNQAGGVLQARMGLNGVA